MMRRFNLLFALALIALTLPAAARAASTPAAIPDLLAKLPAENSVEGRQIIADLVKQGPGAVAAVAALLVPPGAGDDSKARFALNGIAFYVTRPGARAERAMVSSVLLKALATSSDAQVKTFLVNMLQLVGKGEAVAPLAKLLADPDLCEPATQALLRIGAKGVDAALLSALPDAAGANQITLIRALGERRVRAAVPRLIPLAGSTDADLRHVALFALANSGDPSAAEALRDAARTGDRYQRAHATALLLAFARRLAENGKKQECAAICRELLHAPEANVASDALAILAETQGKAAQSAVLDAAGSEQQAVREAALKLYQRYTGKEATRQLVARLQTASPEARAAIVRALGQRGDAAALPAVLNALQDADAVVRLAAVDAVARFDSSKTLASLLSLALSGTTEERAAVLAVLQRLPASTFAKPLPQLTAEAKEMIEQVRKERQLPQPTAALAPADSDLARGKPVTTSTGAQGDHVPGLAVDGNATDQNSAWFGDRWPSWLQVDLGKLTRIGSIQVFFYWDGGRYYQYAVEVSRDGQEWQQVVDQSRNTHPATHRGVLHEIKPVEARYVRLQILKNSANEAVHLVELKVFAPGDTPKEVHAPKPKPDAEGYISLFNGKDLTGWLGSVDGYKVENGAIVCIPEKGGILYTEDEYSDFSFRFEFKLTPGANNGIGIRFSGGNPAYEGMEIQVLDDSAAEYKGIQPYQHHGSIYGVVPAKQGYQKPVGEWNSEEIIARGRQVTVILNGVTIVDANLDQASTPSTADHNPHPGLKNKQGYIGFLGHGSRVEFRNIRIKPFSDNGK